MRPSFGLLFDVLSDFGQIGMHAFRVFPADDVQQFVQFRTDTFHLCRRAGIEQDFLQEEIVFAQHALGDGHVALEGGTRSILMFHDGRKHEGRYERDGQGVGHGFVVFFERVFKDVQLQTLVEVFEENLAQMVAFLEQILCGRGQQASLGAQVL